MLCRVELQSLQIIFHSLADIRDLQAKDDLNVIALLNDAGIGGLVDQLILHQGNVFDIDTQAGEAVFHGVDIVLAAQAFHNVLSVIAAVEGLGRGLVLGGLLQVILTAGSLVVELLDQEAEQEEVDQDLNNTQQQHNGPLGALHTGGQVHQDGSQHIAAAECGNAANLQQDDEQAGDAGMQDIQHGSDKDEHEVQGLRDGGQAGGDDQGNDGSGGALLVVGMGSVDEGSADTDVAEHLGEANGHVVDGVRELAAQLQLGHDDGVCAGNDGITQLQHAAQVSELEGSVNQMVQAGGDQQTLQEAVHEQAEQIGALDEVSQSGNALLHNGPDNVADDTERNGHSDHAGKGEADAGIDLECAVKLLLEGLIEDPAYQAAQQDAAEDAHIDDLDAQDLSLAGAEQAQHSGGLSQLAHLGQHNIGSFQIDQVGHEADQASLMLLPLCQGSGNTDDEQQTQIVDQDHHAFIHQFADDLNGAPLQEGQESGDGAIGQHGTNSQDHARDRQVHQRLHHCLGEHFQGVHEFLHTFFSPLLVVKDFAEVYQ